MNENISDNQELRLRSDVLHVVEVMRGVRRSGSQNRVQ